MKSIDQLPPEDLPLRPKLPAMRPSTREALLSWAVAQPGALPWLLKRGALYWDQFCSVPRGSAHSADATSRDCDGTAALDLLKWRTEAGDDKAAVEHLNAMEKHVEFLSSGEMEKGGKGE